MTVDVMIRRSALELASLWGVRSSGTHREVMDAAVMFADWMLSREPVTNIPDPILKMAVLGTDGGDQTPEAICSRASEMRAWVYGEEEQADGD